MCKFCIHSDDVLCGTLHCDVSAISNVQLVNFQTDWTGHTNWLNNLGAVISTIATYKTFYNGPNRPDPGLVPDGAACGTDMVAVLDKNLSSFRFISLLGVFQRLS